MAAWGTVATMDAPILFDLAIPNPVPTPQMLSSMRRHPEDPSAALLDEIIKHRESLFPPSQAPDLNVSIRDGKIIYSTTANYYTEAPRCAGDPLDIRIAATANFGLRGYVFDSGQCVVMEVGEHNTAYYSVAVDQTLDLLAFAIPGQARIDIYNLDSHEFLQSITGYSATTITFHQGRIYFAGYPTGGDWDRASVFAYSLNTDNVEAWFMREQLADARGIDFYGNEVAVSDGAHHRIVIASAEDFRPFAVVQGLNYPNGVSFTESGELLVADEHNGLIHRINRDGAVVWSSPPFQLISPGSVAEITEGRHKGHYLVADADGNRIIVVDPVSWSIKFEISGTRSVLKAVPIY